MTYATSIGRLFPPQAQSTDKAHGRLEHRCIRTSTELNHYLDFPHLAQVWRIERSVIHLKSAKTTHEMAHGMTDLSPHQADPAQLLTLNRGHWGIENRLHWVQ